jgi:hypothetical protein
METKWRIAFCWLLLGACFILHSYFHLFGLFFGVDVTMPDAAGEVPLSMQVFNTIVQTGTFVLALLSIYLTAKGFLWFSFVWSLLFIVLNIFHWYETVFVEAFDLSQAVLLTFVPVINVLLSVSLWKSLKAEQEHA